MSSAREIEERAARWLAAREETDWSASDQAEFDAWLEASMAHQAAFWRLEHGWREADRIRSLGSIPFNVSPLRERLTRWWKPIAIAASLVALVTSASILWMQQSASERLAASAFETAVGGRRVVSFPDGSRIELNTATRVRAAVTAQRREVWLDRGEAYFDVANAEGLPFVVHAGERTITVLGTRFSVRRDGDRVTVSVLEGRVRVESADAASRSPSSTLEGGEIAVGRGPSTLVTASSTERVASELAWRDGRLTFEQETLAEAAAEFNRYNRRQLVVDDPEAAAIRIGGTFQASNVDAFVRLLRDAYGLRVSEQGDRVRIAS